MSVESEALKIVEEALDIDDAAARAAFVARRCVGNTELLARVTRILGSGSSGSALLKTETFSTALGLIKPAPLRIKHFRVIGEIASGGMGTVLKAERDDSLFQQTVAIKLIRGDIASDRARDRFAEERRILGRLRHPGIVRILDGGEFEGQPWLAMDFIDGQPVTEAFAASGAGPAERLDVFEAVCEAVAYAHRMLVIHADIKPGNILLSSDGSVHLLDFGISRLMIELSGEIAGDPYPLTKGYAAPERTVGVAPTVASDVFSLGMLLFELLTGLLPTAEGPRVPRSMLPAGHLDGDLAAIAARAVAVDPAERYPDVVSLLADLRRHRAHRPVAARADAGWRYRAGRFVRRHRKGLALTAALVSLLVAATLISTVSWYRAEAARREADLRFADARGAARYLIFGLIPRLERLPEALPIRTEAVSVAQRYLLRLSQARQSSDAVRIEAATGLLRLAQYQAGAGRPNLAQPGPADTNLRKAEQVLAQVSPDRAAALQARVHLERARLAVWMQADLAAAGRLFDETQRLVAGSRLDDRALRIELTAVGADLKGWQGHFDEEASQAEAALSLLRDDASRDASLQRSRIQQSKAEALYYAGRPAEALPIYGKALATMEAAYRDDPKDNFVLMRLAQARWNYGTTLMDLKRFAEALAELSQGEREAVAAYAFDPADAEAKRALRVMRNARAQALGFAGRTDEAMTLLAQVRRDDEASLARDPQPRRARDLVFDHTLIGELLDHAGRTAEACREDRATFALYAELERKGMAMAFDGANNTKLLGQRIARNCR